jgi:hypothetical protein
VTQLLPFFTIQIQQPKAFASAPKSTFSTTDGNYNLQSPGTQLNIFGSGPPLSKDG